MQKPLEDSNAGVYRIYNVVNHKCYIGSSIDVYRRLKEHYRNLKYNKHCNGHLQNAWNVYGEECLLFEILEFCIPEVCLLVEQYYMNFYQSYNRQFGYNIDSQAASAGKRLSEETKQKISEKAKGRRLPLTTIEKMRLANLGQRRPKQSESMKTRWDITKKYFGYNLLSDDKKLEVSKKLSAINTNRYLDDKNVINNKPIIATTLNNEQIEFRSLHKAAEYFGVNRKGIKYAIENNCGKLIKLNIIFKYKIS